MCRGFSETDDGESEISGDVCPTFGEGLLCRGIRVTHGAETQTSGDGSPTPVS